MKRKQRQPHHEEHIDETWLIPYADLLTLLLALFIVLFASSTIDAKKFDRLRQALISSFNGGPNFFEMSATVPIELEDNLPVRREEEKDRLNNEKLERELEELRKETEDLQNLKKKLDEYIEANQLTTQLETKLTQDSLKITIRDNTLFASGSAKVKPEAEKLARAISDMLAQHPKYQIEIAGHTDNVPIRNAEFESNWELSFARAYNFMKILAENPKIEPSRFIPVPHGEYSPIDTNDTEEGRARNRRVEVSILRTIRPDRTVDLDEVNQAIPPS